MQADSFHDAERGQLVGGVAALELCAGNCYKLLENVRKCLKM
jgi:hypothetical protein